MSILALLLLFVSSTIAAPSINLPINAQVPPVAIAGQAYEFLFSAFTFTSTDGPVYYTLGDCPSWLQLDGSSRTFHGTPGSNGIGPGEVGSFVADLIARDGAGSTTMSVTFVVTLDPGPRLGTPVAAQLPAFGAFSSPNTLLLTPGTALSLTFSPNTFTDTNVHTMYYAMCANNTPLPSWMKFDPSSLTFSGNTPLATSPSELPQSFGIELAASEVTGFAQAVASFELVIESHMFSFGNSLQIINATIGSSVNFTNLQSDLTLDGQPVQKTDISHVISDAPSWLSLSNGTLDLSGTVPPNVLQQNFTVTATDRFGDSASTVVLIQVTGNSSATLISPITTLKAAIGTNFTYPLNNSLLSIKGINVTVNPGTASAWLEFDSNSLELYGHVPSNLKPQTVQFNVSATEGSQSQSQIVNINVTCESTACPITASHSGTPGATVSANAVSSAAGNASKTWIAAAVILPIATLIGLLTLCFCRHANRCRLRVGPKMKTTQKFMISRPVEGEKIGSSKALAGPIWDRERDQERLSSEASGPLKTQYTQSPNIKRLSRFLLPRSTIDDMDQSPRPDSWQSYVKRLEPSHQRYPAANPEFTAIIEEKTSRVEHATVKSGRTSSSASLSSLTSTDTSPVRRPSQRKRRMSNMNYAGLGIFSGRPTSGFGHGRSEPSQAGSSMFLVNRGIGHGGGGALLGPPGWGKIRRSWRNLSRLSWTSTQSSPNSNDPVIEEGLARSLTEKSFASIISSFPRPSTSNTAHISTRPHVIRETSDDEVHDTDLRKALPGKFSTAGPGFSLPKSGSVKNKALQEFHKHRLQQKSHNPLFSAHLSASRKPSSQVGRNSTVDESKGTVLPEPVTPPKQILLRSRSQSSSFEPISLGFSPTQLPRSASTLRRKRSRINYHFTTRALSPLRRSRSSYASTTGSSKFSDPVGVAPFYPHGALLEDTDDEGNKRWRHPHHPNPLGTNKTDVEKLTDVSDVELIRSLRAAGQFNAAQRLSYLMEQTEGDGTEGPELDTAIEVRSARGRMLDHRSGIQSGDSGNKSMEGDIVDAGGSSAFV